MTPLLITNSRLTCFRECPRKHKYQYVDGIRPVLDAEALTFGTLMHAALEAWWGAWQNVGPGGHVVGGSPLDRALAVLAAWPELDDVVRARAEILMTAYDARWADAMELYEVLGVEEQFEGPVIIPATAKRARGLRVAGKKDVRVRRRDDSSIWVVEHKTSGSDLSAGSTYWNRLRMDSQVSLYHDSEPGAAGILYDVIGKPDIRPLKATPVEDRKYTKPSKAEPEPRLYANQRAEDETLEEFKARMAGLVAENPDRYLARAEVVRLESELEASRQDTLETALMIRRAVAKNMHPRNVASCYKFGSGSPCSFVGVCEGREDIHDPALFKVGPIHPELKLDQVETK